MTEAARERVEAQNVSLYPADWAVVDDLDARFGLGRSGALRMIIRQWASYQDFGVRVLTDRDAEGYEVQG